ncbi:hypothetical protein GWN42_24070 [candidate division KSB1 bacterium]|nr:hypothetical protein [Phycisphaerae bacterium]NIV95784.1 hypothetical protein [candidate division KSB1 bacterium]
MSWDSCKGRGKKYTDEFRALVKYASGIHCEPPEDSDFGWKARRRISMANKLRNKFASE